MRLVAQTLQEIEHRIAWVERERRPSPLKKPLAPGIAVWPLGDRHDRDVGDAEFSEHALGDAELPLAAVDEHEIGPPSLVALWVLAERPAEAALQHLAHHRVVVAARLPLTLPL